MLKFYFLNVGHGSSTVVSYTDPDGRQSFGVVDSNKKGGETPPALRCLQRLGANDLAFVALTHPHADHYKGMGQIMDHYSGRISHAFSFPIDRDVNRLRKWAGSYSELAENTVNEELLQEFEELLRVVHGFHQMGDSWEPLSNLGARLHVEAMQAVNITLLLPPSSVKGEFFASILSGQSAYKQDRDNRLSLAIRFEYAGRTIVLGGDGTYDNWMYIRQRTSRNGATGEAGLSADIVNLPHHGSRRDADPLVLDYLFGTHTTGRARRENGDPIDQDDRIAIVSADGRSHPHGDVLRHIGARGVRPFCTNLSKVCSPAQPVPNVACHGVEQVLERFVASAAIPTSRPATCQGDICVSISTDGSVSVDRQFNVACAFRGELDFLAAK
ncbi:ComEC/Rec2 family competence protein [Stenotrophomonas maltophilia]|uniref:ComEC/Rec2 family competence protein n=1 Tax=Stenotrophomonas maltophilia TaxID=40324 RepID=UPI0034D4745C